MDMNLGKLQEMVRGREAWHASMESQRVGHDLATEQQYSFQPKIWDSLWLDWLRSQVHLWTNNQSQEDE